MLERLLKLTKNNSNVAKINEIIPVKKITIAWNVLYKRKKLNMQFRQEW